MKKILPVLTALFMCLLAFQIMAQTYVPLTVTSGFNKDLIANGSGSASGSTNVPGGFDGAPGNVYYSDDFTGGLSGPCSTGIPHTITKLSVPVYNIPSFGNPSCLYMESTGDGGTLYFSGSGSFQEIWLLASSANHPSVSAVFDAEVFFSDGTSFITTFTVPDWVVPVGTYDIAYTTGRVGYTDNIYNACGNTKLYNCKIDLSAHKTQVVASIYCHKTSTSAQRCAIFAVCGITAAGGPAKVIVNPESNVHTYTFDANWEPAPGPAPTSYRLDVSTDPGFGSFVPGYNNLDVGDVTTATVTGLSASMTYYYRVRGVNASGVGPNSDNEEVTTVNHLPQPVIADAETNVLGTKFVAHWHPTEGDPYPPTSYRLDVSTDPGFGSFVPGYNNLDVGDVTTLQVSGLTPSTNYYYRVRGVNDDGTGSSSNYEPVQTTNGLPPATVATPATAVVRNMFLAHWNADESILSEPVDSYYIDVSTDPGFGSFLPGYENRNVGFNTMCLVSGTTEGITYYYRVRAHNYWGSSPSSNVITVITVPANIPTLSEWGLIILGLVLLGAGTLYITRWHS